MDTQVCPVDTVRRSLSLLAVLAALCAASPAYAQTAGQAWRRIGNSSVDTGLASTATGAVAAVWFSPDGSQLFARTQAGRTFVSGDLETWKPAPADAAPGEQLAPATAQHLPEANAGLRAARDGRIFALGTGLSVSEDGGRGWTDLTGFGDHSVIGSGQHDLAISPLDPQILVVANDSGVWRSNDGGLSWSGLNDNLPNLPVRAIAGSGRQIVITGMGTAVRDSVSRSWRITVVTLPDDEQRAQATAALGTQIAALAGSGDTWYAGSADGRLWVSTDRRATWTLSLVRAAGPIERIYVNPDSPRIAFAAASASGAHILRTVNAGLFWDDITGALINAPAHGITADKVSGTVYVATDRGVFSSHMEINVLGPVSAWAPVGAGLPTAPAMDVALDASAANLFAAIDGYGVYTMPAPNQPGAIRLVNAADLSQRAAAPGSLYSILGAQIQSARSGTAVFPVLASSPDASQIQVPFDIAPSQLNLTVQRTAGAVILGLAVKAVSPVIFLDRDGAPMLLDADSGLMLDAGASVHARTRVQVLATGLGKVTPEWPSGIPAPAENPPAVAASVTAMLNGLPVQVTRATLAPGYVGLYLVEIQLPALMDSGTEELYLSIDGQESNRVRVAIDAVP